MGRPLLIGDEADKQLQEYVHSLRATGAAVNTAVVIASAEGILLSKDVMSINDAFNHSASSKKSRTQ